MQTYVQKWGNSLAFRIPKAFAKEMNLLPDSPIEVTFIGGKLVISPILEPELTLEELLAGVTEDNLHDEIETNSPVGNETW